ncbi:glycine receptor subunit alpha-4 isoform X2 [Halyomorpha halys]|uniref:glycine receptor subunit alpha-4 isoform X2 n=1 Tax=Halyomorpha halys TaxID=286706 RepID=UPI0034D201DC
MVPPATLAFLSVLVASQGLDRFALDSDYDKYKPPDSLTYVNVSLFIHRVSAVDESKEEISLEVFLQVYWIDNRINVTSMESDHIELNWDKDQKIWVPDLYIRQLRDMKILTLFQEMTFVRLYQNRTLRVSMGATILIKCDMDFVLYPLDVQKCAVDFSSYKYTEESMVFQWLHGKSSLSFPSDFGKDGYRLPKYVVTFEAQNDSQCVFYGEGNHSTARMLITMSREIRSHLLESYLPSTLFVIMSWGSFVVMPEVVPGRMVLLVTTLLSLVTMFDTIRNNSPSALELKCIEVWLISCTLFVFLALLEYFIVLFGIRYDKHWRHKKAELDLQRDINAQLARERLNRLFGQNNTRIIPQHNHTEEKEPTPTETTEIVSPPPPPLPPTPQPQENHTNSISKAPTPTVPEAQHILRVEADNNADVIRSPRLEPMSGKQKFQMLTQHVILYVGSQRGTIDQISLALFPFCFTMFAVIYWISYLSESRRRATE